MHISVQNDVYLDLCSLRTFCLTRSTNVKSWVLRYAWAQVCFLTKIGFFLRLCLLSLLRLKLLS